MAGIYIHIPFCKQACNYCNFHFVTSLRYKDELIEALHNELILRKNELNQAPIQSVYFGGGTPSLLNSNELNRLIGLVDSHFSLQTNAEITLEANPDDLDKSYIKALRDTPINRLSIGVQSFADEDLKWMNRAHNASQADYAIKAAQDAGFTNMSIDLIYGTPTTTNEIWNANLQKTIHLQIDHISAYSLTVEPETPLAKQIKLAKKVRPHNEQAADQMDLLLTQFDLAGIEQYEISNFARNQKYALHNTNYWKQVPYLGIGPAAHSFNGLNRSWNVANNQQYIQAIIRKELPSETEILTPIDQWNEWIMTGLRTKWGCNLTNASKQFGDSAIAQLQNDCLELLEKKWVIIQDETLLLTREGKFYADQIMSDLFQTK
jgi:oxygen-independent coproporphyrinogen-3 oxidase